MNIATKLKAALRKNLPELTTGLSGRFPRFVYGSESLPEIPVFVFHEVDETFENYLRYLHDNGYSTVSVAEFCAQRRAGRGGAGKRVLITFDDGHVSLWRHAYPVLQKYAATAVCFLCPGLVPEGDEGAPQQGRRLCNWAEIRAMHASGRVEFQLHGLYHNLVFTDSGVRDFFSPAFRTHFLGKTDTAAVVAADAQGSLTNLWPYEGESSAHAYGMPLFALRPRLATTARFALAPELKEKMAAFVRERGGATFFAERGWRQELLALVARYRPQQLGWMICGASYQDELAGELVRAREIMLQHLPGTTISHLCYPWFLTTGSSLRTARECGYETAFLGSDAHRYGRAGRGSGALLIQRLAERYIYFLPGTPRKNFYQLMRGGGHP